MPEKSWPGLFKPPMVPGSGRGKALAETVSCCRTTCHWLRSGRNRAWKLGLKPWTTIYGCYLPQADPWGSHVLPCGTAYVSCQAKGGPQSWTEHLGSAVAASTSPYWTVPAWCSVELGPNILAGGFWMLTPTPHIPSPEEGLSFLFSPA